MSDKETIIDELKSLIESFVDERDWKQFHSPKNISMSISIEAAELMELFQWLSLDEAKETVKNAFSSHIEKGLEKSYGRKINYKQVIRNWLKFFWIMRIVVKNARIVRSIFTAKTGELLLSSLLHKSSPYNKDFMPIYDVITK